MKKLFDKWIAVDWGTSSFRAYLVQNNKVSDTIETKDGMKFVKSHLFEQTLLSLIDRWLDDDKITDIKDLNSSEKSEITFLHSKKYTDLAKKTKASYCVTLENLSKFTIS